MSNIRGASRTSLGVAFCLSILPLVGIACGSDGGAPTEPEVGDTGEPNIPTSLAEWEAEHVVPDASSQSLVVSNHLIIRVTGSATPSEIVELGDKIDGEVVGSFAPSDGNPAVYQFEISDPSLEAVEDAAAKLRQEPEVLVSVPRALRPPSGHLDNDERPAEDVWAYHRVNLSETWHLLERQKVSRAPVSVGILDTGLDDTHVKSGEFANTTIKGINLLSNAQTQDWRDRIGHGTQVAGVVAAENNNRSFNGVLGPDADGYTLVVYRVAGRLPLEDFVIDLPDWVRELFCLGDSNEGECGYTDNAAVLAATSCARTGQVEAESLCPQADVMNYSYTGGPALMKELENTPEDFILVAGAGNGGDPIRLSGDLDSRFYLVGGTNRNDGRWNTGMTSNYSDGILAAPGESVTTTQLAGGETVARGTSVAAPFVSGAVALLWQLGEPVFDIKATLRRTAQSIDVNTPAGKQTWLRVDICRAVADVLGLTDPSKRIIAESGEGRNQPPSDLYFVEPFECGTDSLVDRIQTSAGETPVITDLALDADSSLWGASFEKLYRIKLEDGTAREVGEFGIEGVNGLDFAPDGTLYGAAQNVGIFGSPEPGSLLRIDPATAETVEIGEFGPGLEPAGDLAFADDGTLFGALRVFSTDDNVLATIDTATGRATLVDPDASLGFSGVLGLQFVEGSLFGLTADGAGSGKLIVIDTETGVGELIRTLSFGAFGAANRSP